MRPGAVRWAAALAALLLASTGTTCGATLRLHSAPVRYLRNQHIQERATELYNAYRSRLVTLPARPRKLIFTCNSAALCGGLGDRLKGLASTFVLAVLTDAEFMVDWEEPVRDLCVDCGARLRFATALLSCMQVLKGLEVTNAS